MVDMVEARKRAKAKLKSTTNLAEKIQEQPPSPEQGKPVLRSETPTPDEKATYFPVEHPVPEKGGSRKAQPLILAPEPVPAEIVPEDQVDFLQRLMQDAEEEDESAQGSEQAAPVEEWELLMFELGNERYGLAIESIAEIIRFLEPTEVPNTLGYLDGIISLRGRIIPVINGRKRLGHPAKLPDKKSRIIVINENSEAHGILVDSASQVIRIPKAGIEPTPSVVVGVDSEFIDGVSEHQGQLVILLNLARFLQFR